MKKTFKKVTAISLMLFSVHVANAQIDLGKILGGVLDSKSKTETTASETKSNTANDIISGLTSIFSSSKQASKNNIIGTWTYSEPAIVLTSDNVVTNMAAKVAAGKIEEKLSGVLTKYGIKEGALQITFNEDGTFVEKIAGKTITGKWAVEDSKLNLTFGKYSSKKIPVTTQIERNQLMFVTDASKLLGLIKNVGSKSSNTNIKTITKLMDKVNGMQAGLTLVKQ